MLGLKLYLVDLRGKARYHVAIVPNELLSAYLDTSIFVVFLSLQATPHILYTPNYSFIVNLDATMASLSLIVLWFALSHTSVESKTYLSLFLNVLFDKLLKVKSLGQKIY